MFLSLKKHQIIQENNRIQRSFFMGEDVLQIAQDLLGKKICVSKNKDYFSAIIVETEAYKAPEDEASHAYQNRITPRTSTMFMQGGTAYVYICYGIHKLFNIITGPVGLPHAVLIRAVEPVEGISKMLANRKLSKLKKQVTGGPGCLTKAMGIGMEDNAIDLCGQHSHIWIEEGPNFNENLIIEKGIRIGVESAGESALLPYRFTIKGNKYLSR